MSAPERPRSLYDSALARGRVVRHLDIVCLIVDAGGAMVMPMAEFQAAQKWAASRIASGNVLSDRSRFLERVLTVVSRPGSLVPTRGNNRQIEAVARSMRAAGYDLGEWSLPAEIKKLPW